MMGPTQGAIVNWCGHRYGYRNFATRDGSRNFLPFDFLTMGELFQNNHHRASSRLNFAWRKFEFDPTYQVLRMLAWMRVIRLMPIAEEATSADRMPYDGAAAPDLLDAATPLLCPEAPFEFAIRCCELPPARCRIRRILKAFVVPMDRLRISATGMPDLRHSDRNLR